MLKTKILLNTCLIVCALCIPLFSMAALDIGVQDSDINLNLTPENPEPYQDVTMEITSYATDLNKATIEWKTGSKTLLSGIGRTKYSFTTSGPNVPSVFDVTIRPSEGGDPITKRISINPSEIEIMWEAVDGYTPPFYKGKSFISPEGLIKAVAMPGTVKTGNSITYTWKNNGEVVQNASGYNKNSYIFQNKTINTKERIGVEASSVNGGYDATKTIDIPIIQPKIIFYKKSPTEGILYNKALVDETSMTEDEMTIVAEPYFLAWRGNEGQFNYNWQINDKDIDTPSKKTELTVRPTSRGGYATVNLSMENFSTLYQKVKGMLRINL